MLLKMESWLNQDPGGLLIYLVLDTLDQLTIIIDPYRFLSSYLLF